MRGVRGPLLLLVLSVLALIGVSLLLVPRARNTEHRSEDLAATGDSQGVPIAPGFGNETAAPASNRKPADAAEVAPGPEAAGNRLATTAPGPASDDPAQAQPPSGPDAPEPDDGAPPQIGPSTPVEEDPETDPVLPGKGVKMRVNSKLDWLAAHQHDAGQWRASLFGEDTKRKSATRSYNAELENIGIANADAAADETYSVGVSGLALLAMSGAGYDHKEGPYKPVVRKALLKLKEAQREDGCLADPACGGVLLNHVLALAAFAEMYALSGDNLLKTIVEKGAGFLAECQRDNGGWGDEADGAESNTRATAWAVLTFKTCKMAGIERDYEPMKRGAAFMESLTVGEGDEIRTWYDERNQFRPGITANASLDAMNVVCQLMTARMNRDHPTIRAQVKRIAAHLPSWTIGDVDLECWYWTGLAVFQSGDTPVGKRSGADETREPPELTAGQKWLEAVTTVLTEHQRGFAPADKQAEATAETLDEYGSWDAVDVWSRQGGRVWTTAMASIVLDITFRYMRVSGR
ncbi:MAG: hypothetical protein IT462_11755 [Planctomycetes bacterium]|nr:hypothetical protein [Planctomycetota bacterium]